MSSHEILFSIQSILYFILMLAILIFSIILLAKKKGIAGILMTVGSALNIIIGAFRRLEPLLFTSEYSGASAENYMMRQALIGIADLFFYAIFVVGLIILILENIKPKHTTS
ncbi:hypothetical protein ACFQ1M_08840 [Sungkyunkwania multivorans]|uniref:Uncharacterized protein n=1 Tax=Sungkyunkwania multivorans TaxID=1173618 RepID=A0ABW3CXQ7_9FLAO